MQDEVNAKMSGLAKTTGKTALRFLWRNIQKVFGKIQAEFKTNRQQKPTKVTHGKTSIKKLSAQDKGMKSFELPDTRDVAQFDRIMKRYGVDYAIKRDTTGEKPKALVFFKGQDMDAFSQAFKEFSKVTVKNAPRPSAIEKMEKLQEQIKLQPTKEKAKELVR